MEATDGDWQIATVIWGSATRRSASDPGLRAIAERRPCEPRRQRPSWSNSHGAGNAEGALALTRPRERSRQAAVTRSGRGQGNARDPDVQEMLGAATTPSTLRAASRSSTASFT